MKPSVLLWDFIQVKSHSLPDLRRRDISLSLGFPACPQLFGMCQCLAGEERDLQILRQSGKNPDPRANPIESHRHVCAHMQVWLLGPSGWPHVCQDSSVRGLTHFLTSHLLMLFVPLMHWIALWLCLCKSSTDDRLSFTGSCKTVSYISICLRKKL